MVRVKGVCGVSVVTATAIILGLAGAIPSGFAADDVMNGTEAGETAGVAPYALHAKFDREGIESLVQAEIIKALLLYQADGSAAFDAITPAENTYDDTIYPFVLNATTFETVANGAFSNLAGTVPDDIVNADRPADHIIADLNRDGGAWAEYMATNPDTGSIQLKRAFLYLHDGYIFGSGHYLQESRVKHAVDTAVRLFDSEGQAAFETITPRNVLRTAEPYPFVFVESTLETVAHGAIPDRIGHVPYSILTTGDRPIEVVLADLERDGNTWVEYVFTNPDTDTKQLKRTWLYLYNGYIFGSGYYLPDSRVQSHVEEALHLYKSHGTSAFDIITPEVARPLVSYYPFIINATSAEIVAHGARQNLVGSTADFLDAADRSLERIREDLARDGSTWVAYMSVNVDTRTLQLTRTHLSLYDGYIFGAGYHMPDSRAQSMADKAIYAYKSLGTDAFDVITSGEINEGSLYPFVRNSTSYVIAVGKNHHLLGTQPTITGVPLHATTDTLGQRGGSTWRHLIINDPSTETEQIKRTWYTTHDGYLFGTSYTVADSDVQSIVDYAVFIYESNKENNEWVNIITPPEVVATNELYPFVLNKTTLETVAHGAIPDRIGHVPYAILNTGDRPIEAILADLERDGSTWAEYTFTNPGTDTQQPKRTYLYMRDGLIFASGYYVFDAQIQTIAHGGVLEYLRDGKDAFLANADAMREVVSTYLFVVDPHTGVTLAQGVDPSTLRNISEWQVILQHDASAARMGELEAQRGKWIEYEFTNPLTGQTEPKRTWLTTFDGLVFGAGYYASDVSHP